LACCCARHEAGTVRNDVGCGGCEGTYGRTAGDETTTDDTAERLTEVVLDGLRAPSDLALTLVEC